MNTMSSLSIMEDKEVMGIKGKGGQEGKKEWDNEGKCLGHDQNSKKRPLIQQIAYPFHRQSRKITDDGDSQ